MCKELTQILLANKTEEWKNLVLELSKLKSADLPLNPGAELGM